MDQPRGDISARLPLSTCLTAGLLNPPNFYTVRAPPARRRLPGNYAESNQPVHEPE
jgi:hypothetical protein